MNFRTKLCFSGTLTPNTSNLDVSSQTNLVKSLVKIAKDLKLFYVNQLCPNRHTREDPFHGTSDILDMAFISLVLVPETFLSALLMITWAVITSPSKFHLTSHSNVLTEPRYQFDKTDDDLLHNTLKDSLNNIDTNITTQDELEELAVTLCDKLMKAVNSSKSYTRNDPKSPVSQAILDLIKEKRRLRRLYNSTQDPNTKPTINKLQEEIRTKVNQESTISWENSATPLA